jgi:hypothetical protein
VRRVEHAIDIWDLRGLDARLNTRMLHEHLNDFAAEGWELVWLGLNVELADHRAPCHVLVFKRVFEEAPSRSSTRKR